MVFKTVGLSLDVRVATTRVPLGGEESRRR